MRPIFLGIISFLLVSSCPLMEVSKGDRLRALIAKTGAMKLPFTYDLRNGPSKRPYEIDIHSSDTLLFKRGMVEGYLPDTVNFFGILHYEVGDLIYPVLSTFDKQGNLIDKKSIGIGACGGLVIDIKSCIDKVTISQRMMINSYYKVIGTAEDKDGQEIGICNSITGKGKVAADGKIEYVQSKIVDCN